MNDRSPKRHWLRWALLWLAGGAFACGLAAPALALDPDRAIQQYTHVWYQEELPQNSVLSIVQRRDGSMWFATYGGIARYSGAEFKLINRRNVDALKSNAISALLEDNQGTLWIATLNGGLYRMRGDAEVPERIDLPHPINSVFAIAQDVGGALWLGTNVGVWRWDTGGAQRFAEAQAIGRAPIRALGADAVSGVWVATEGAGVGHFHDGALEVFGPSEGLPSLDVWDIQADRSGVIWVGTQAGLARYRDGRFERVPAAAVLDDSLVSTILGDRDGNLWATSVGHGLCRLNEQGFECDREMDELTHDAVQSMFEDREGNVWVGGTASGVHRLSDSKLATAVGALDTNSIRALCEDPNGTLWAGTDGAGLALLRGFTLVPYEFNAKMSSGNIRALHCDTRGNLWVGSLAGLTRVEPNGRVVNFEKAAGLPGPRVFAIAPDAESGLWIGTSGGLARLREGRLESITAAGANDIRSLYQDRDGRLWIGQRSGLQCLREAVLDQCGTDGLPDASVFAFHEAVDGAIWLGTSTGLMRMRDGRLTRYAEHDGFIDDNVFAILEDAAGDFWTSSNGGITRLAQADFPAFDSGVIPALRPTSFGKKDGMLSNQTNGASQAPGVRTRDGRLWFASPRGVVLVDTNRLKHNDLAPPVAIERVVVDTLDIAPLRAGVIGPGVEKLELHYAAMSYVSPSAVRYRYRLEGFDRDWVEAGARRVAYYTNLSPGDYAFRVIACNNDGVWNGKGATFSFKLQPYFTQTVWFDALRAALAIIVLGGLYWMRMQIVSARADVLDERNRIAREIHDSLAQGLAGIAMQLQSVKRAQEIAPTRVAPLLARADVLFKEAMEETRRAIMALRPLALERYGLVNALRELVASYPSTVNPIDFRLTGEPGKMPDVMELHLFRLAQEGIANAIQHANAGVISVRLDFGKRALRLEVYDDGKGIVDGPLPSNRGLGLSGMRKRVAQLGGQIKFESPPEGGTILVVIVSRPSRFSRWREHFARKPNHP